MRPGNEFPVAWRSSACGYRFLWYNIHRADIVPRAPVCDAQPGQLTELLCKAAAAAGRLNDEMCKVSN